MEAAAIDGAGPIRRFFKLALPLIAPVSFFLLVVNIVYAMFDGGYRPDRGYNKCSRVVGDVMGQYHPHGDSAIYDALVRLVQPWSMRYPLVDGQGNFGSPGNDGAAAPRYTECRMAPLAMELVRDIHENTVDFVPNYESADSAPALAQTTPTAPVETPTAPAGPG